MGAMLKKVHKMTKAQHLPGTVALHGKVDGRFAFLTVESTFAAGLLPKGLELSPQAYCPAGFHPLLLMFNKTELQPNEKIESISKRLTGSKLELNYNEFIVMLPYVQFKNPAYQKKGPYCFLPILYLDSIWAVLGGRMFWEFNKQMAEFQVEKNAFGVSTEVLGSTILTSNFAEKAPPILNSEVPNFVRIEPILRLPVIEHGVYGYVSSIYRVEYEKCMITPCEMELQNRSCDSMPKGVLKSPSILDSPMGCFTLNYDWTLTWIEFIAL